MKNFLGKIGFVIFTELVKNYFLEIQLFAFIRSFKDGITFFNFNINLDRYIDDHKPSFQIELTILNFYNQIHIYKNNF